MKSIKALPVKNLIRKPVRSISLMILAAFLAFTAFGGTVVVMSLTNGLDSLSARLGADVVVVPYSATGSSVSYDSIIIQGQPGQFYMDSKYYNEIKDEIEGIEKVTAQFYLASAKSSCCSNRMQIIGFDPDTDFSVQPWVQKSYSGGLGYLDAVAGCNLTPNSDMTVKIFGVTLNVVSTLNKTGTELDNALYVNIDTIKELIKAHNVKFPNQEKTVNPDKVVSSVLIKVQDGYDIDDVVADINLHVRQVKAIRTQNMISELSDSLSGVSGVIGALIAVVWILSLAIMAIVHTMTVNERKKEFAVLRVLGASGSRLAQLVLSESVMVSLAGSVIGTVFAAAVLTLFSGTIESSIGLPFLMPQAFVMIITGVIAVVLTAVVGAVTSAMAAVKMSRLDIGQILRGDNG